MATTSTNVQPSPQSRQASIDRAATRALGMARQGVRPELLRSVDAGDGLSTTRVYGVPSRSGNGRTYLVSLIADCDGFSTHCDCQAGQVDTPCWHRSLVRMAALDVLPAVQPPAKISAWELSGGRGPQDESDFVNFGSLVAAAG